MKWLGWVFYNHKHLMSYQYCTDRGLKLAEITDVTQTSDLQKYVLTGYFLSRDYWIGLTDQRNVEKTQSIESQIFEIQKARSSKLQKTD